MEVLKQQWSLGAQTLRFIWVRYGRAIAGAVDASRSVRVLDEGLDGKVVLLVCGHDV